VAVTPTNIFGSAGVSYTVITNKSHLLHEPRLTIIYRVFPRLLGFDGKWYVGEDLLEFGISILGAADNYQALVTVEGGDNTQVIVGFDYLG